LKEGQLFTHGFNLFNDHNIHVLSSHDKDSETLKVPLSIGVYSKRIVIPGDFLAEGGYNCSFAIMRYSPFHVEFHELDIVGFNIIDNITNEARGGYSGKYPGVVRPVLNWK
jgi:lipopolysaccharide transport system ATP-binding protein